MVCLWSTLCAERSSSVTKEVKDVEFSSISFLAESGVGRKIMRFKAKQALFSQGDPADCLYYLQSGRAKVTVLSKKGKEATIAVLSKGDFIGEEAIVAVPGRRLATAVAMVASTALRIERSEMIRVIHEENAFSDMFLGYMLARSMRMQADLVDKRFNSSERRLARILVMMAEIEKSEDAETRIPKISQAVLAEMVGTTRPRVNFFMNRFRRLGFIQYNGHIHVHKSLLNIVLHD
ncbi:MAG: Crp/Fnr family transcriptional regulator [Acidobacteria bacterium]|nr:Crp/Fnr family transcriptional regulator [Acidobacteriota bacterium]